MSFQIFGYIRRCAVNIFTSDVVKNIFEYMKLKIVEQVKNSISGEEKKRNVDIAVTEFIKANIKSKNPVSQVLINIIVEYVPILTQYVYEYLKKRIDGLTEG
jgi:hypothetical protein